MRVAGGLLATLLIGGLLGGCTDDAQSDTVDPARRDAVAAPEVGACRVLTREDVARASNATPVVDCAEPHTAQTFVVGELPERMADLEHDDPALGRFAYPACSTAFADFVGGDESLVMRSVVSWAWFRPSPEAWEDGARWFRCDVVGGGHDSVAYVDLPEDAAGLLAGRVRDRWLVCADGPTVAASARVPCSEPHQWRAVSTIKLGEPEDPYPGDRLVEVRTRDYCNRSVGAILGYLDSYDFAYTWFHEAEWQVGNRRSVCWARTTQ